MTGETTTLGVVAEPSGPGISITRADEIVGLRVTTDRHGNLAWVDIQHLAGEEIVETQLTPEATKQLYSMLGQALAIPRTPAD